MAADWEEQSPELDDLDAQFNALATEEGINMVLMIPYLRLQLGGYFRCTVSTRGNIFTIFFAHLVYCMQTHGHPH